MTSVLFSSSRMARLLPRANGPRGALSLEVGSALERCCILLYISAFSPCMLNHDTDDQRSMHSPFLSPFIVTVRCEMYPQKQEHTVIRKTRCRQKGRVTVLRVPISFLSWNKRLPAHSLPPSCFTIASTRYIHHSGKHRDEHSRSTQSMSRGYVSFFLCGCVCSRS